MKHDQLGLDAALLESAVRAGLPREHASLRDLFTRRPQWADLYAVEGDLPAALLERLRIEGQVQDGRWVAELLAEASGRAGPRATLRARPRPPWILAAAGILLGVGALLWWTTRPVGDADRVQTLGHGTQDPVDVRAGELSCLGPKGPVPDYGTFRWQLNRTLATGEDFVVRIFAVASDGTPGALLETQRTRDSSWTPAAEPAASLPNRIAWTVSLSEEGFEGPAASTSAERSPR